jgi:hypothetical protein
MNINDLEKGMRVRYVPMHANDDVTHPDCEDGVVSSIDCGGCAFVKYDNAVMKMVTGDEPYTSQRTNARDLVKL